MENLRLGIVESYFADIIWNNEPVSSGELVKICEKELDWKKSPKWMTSGKLKARHNFFRY